MGNFNSFVDKLDMDFCYEACAKNGKLCHYKKGEFFVQQGDVIRYMGIVKEGYSILCNWNMILLTTLKLV